MGYHKAYKNKHRDLGLPNLSLNIISFFLYWGSAAFKCRHVYLLCKNCMASFLAICKLFLLPFIHQRSAVIKVSTSLIHTDESLRVLKQNCRSYEVTLLHKVYSPRLALLNSHKLRFKLFCLICCESLPCYETTARSNDLSSKISYSQF